MSRNYELLQRISRFKEPGWADAIGNISVPEAALPAAERQIDRPLLDVSAEPEIHQLVQRLFFNQGNFPVAAVTFNQVERVGLRPSICGRAAEVLAAQVRESVCVLDADLGAPSLHKHFGVANDYGLMEALLEPGPITKFAHKVRGRELTVVTAGQAALDWKSVATSAVMATRVQELRRYFTYVLIDAPALSNFADAAFLGRLTDGVVLIVEAHSTRRDVAARVSQQLQQENIAVLGAVLNNRTFPIPQSLYSKLF